jgi:DinB superfamily
VPEREAWLRGPVPGVPPSLQPAAHAIQHAVDDIAAAVDGLTWSEVWASPGGAPSVGFHARHLAGALDRLLTYARGEALDDEQRKVRLTESDARGLEPEPAALVRLVQDAADRAVAQIRSTPEALLLDARGVGRLQLPSTVLGLIFHAGEHAARHAGQAITTARIVRGLRQTR